MEIEPLRLAEIEAAREELGERVLTTPTWRWRGREIEEAVGGETQVLLKLELFQLTGSFKPRGALLNVLALPAEARARGVVAVSAGNHAIAVAFTAASLGLSAKVVMLATANPARLAACRAWGASIELARDGATGFARAQEIASAEGRAFIHPFEGRGTALGTATVALELCRVEPRLEAVIVPIGGGGLAAGIANAVKLLQPRCEVFGVEPSGADTMHRSFAAGSPQAIEGTTTIADSLAAPHAAPFTFALCRRYLDGLVRVEDDELRRAMALLFAGAKLAVEPAGAAALAALCGPLRERLAGKRVALVVSGTNIDAGTFARHLEIGDRIRI